MPLLVRKIELAKWRNVIEKQEDVPSADAITIDMQTRGNRLSIWEIDNEREIEEAILAYVSIYDHLETIDIVIIKPSCLEDNGLNLIASKGNTLYSRFADRHREIIELDYESLGRVAQCIVESMRLVRIKRFTVPKLKGILTKGLEMKKIKLDDLKEGIGKHLKDNI